MINRKTDFSISLFGLPKCHFEFSHNEIASMRGFNRNYERLLQTEFLKQRMDQTPIVFAGAVKDIPEVLWSDFNDKFRPFLMTRDPHHYLHVRHIAFRHPRRGPTKAIRRQIDRLIDHQRKVAEDSFTNDGIFDFKTSSGEIVSAFDLWNMYMYTYHFHTNWMPDHEHKRILDLFGFNPDNPQVRPHLTSCLIIKMAAFARVHDHASDILFFIDNPTADEKLYMPRSRRYPTETVLEEKTIERQLFKRVVSTGRRNTLS